MPDAEEAAAAGRRPVPFRGGGFVPRPHRLAGGLGLLTLAALWQLGSARGWISPLMAPAPVEVLAALWAIAADGTLAEHLAASLWRIGAGWALGTLAGLAVGLAMGIFSLARAVALPVVSALFPIPKIALLPLLILWLGIGEPSKVATIALGTFFPTVIAAFSGVDGVPRSLIRMAQSFGVPPARILWSVLLPGALPGILAGFRITASIALILVVAAEMIGAEVGIGAFILQAGNLMRTDQLLAGVLVLSLLGLLVAAALSRAERLLLRWR